MKKFFLAFILGLLIATSGFLAMDYFGMNFSDLFSIFGTETVSEVQLEKPLPKRPANPIMNSNGTPFSTPFNAGSN